MQKMYNKVFRTACYIALNDRPYSDHHDLLELQEKNGMIIAPRLRSRIRYRYSSTLVIEHTTEQMSKKVSEQVQCTGGKLSILIDE